MKKLLNNSVLVIILLIGLAACKDKYADLHPDLVKNLQVLEKDEFLANADFEERLFFEGELISETKGEGYFVSAGTHFIIENGRMSFFPSEIEILHRDYQVIAHSLKYVYDAIPDYSSLIDLPLGIIMFPNSVARVFKSSVANLELGSENLSYEIKEQKDGRVLINFINHKSKAPYPFNGTYTFDAEGHLEKVELVNFNSFSHLFWSFLDDFDYSNFTIEFKQQNSKLVINKINSHYSKDGYEYLAEMNFEETNDLSVDFIDRFYEKISINQNNPYVFKNKNRNLPTTHIRRESNYYLMDTDSVKHSSAHFIDSLTLKNILTDLENGNY
ncbi:hypothetical protein ACFCT7_08630 [Fulvivirgaceae bacterium LMO-SS25]